MDQLYKPADILLANKPLFDQTVASLDDALSPTQHDVKQVIAQAGSFEIVKGLVEIEPDPSVRDDAANLEAISTNTRTVDDAKTVTTWLINRLTHRTRQELQRRTSGAAPPESTAPVDNAYLRMTTPNTVSCTQRDLSSATTQVRLSKAEFIHSRTYHTAKGYLTYFDDSEETGSISRQVSLVVVDDEVIEAETRVFTGHREYTLCAQFFPNQIETVIRLLAGNFQDEDDLDHKLNDIIHSNAHVPPSQVLDAIKQYCLSVKDSTPLNRHLDALPNLRAIQKLRDTLRIA
jgi:hypothetical protein